MAIYHCNVKVVSRRTGRSSVGAAAYRAGEKLKNERDGISHDYTKRTDVSHSEIILPDNAPESYKDRSKLWNEVERAEDKSTRRNTAQTAREIEVALPVELSRDEQIKLVRSYVKENFTDRGMCADFSIHAGHKRRIKDREEKHDQEIIPDNPHVHIMLTTRTVTPEGFKGKDRTWNDKKLLEVWREQWAAACNRTFEKKNLPVRIDHRTLQAQGIDREPTIHKGAAAHQMEKRGKESDRGKYNKGVRERNMAYERDFDALQRMVDDMRRQQEQAQEHAQRLEADAVWHPEWEDERATRDIQRGGGLGREKYAQAKAEELSETDRRSMLEQIEALEADELGPVKAKPKSDNTEEDAEFIAERLNQLRNQYIDMEMHDAERSERTGKIREKVFKIQSQADRVKSSAENIVQIAQRITEMQRERDGLGIFKGKEKRQLDDNIKSLKKSHEQAIDTFRRNFNIEPEQASAAVAGLQKKVQDMQSHAQSYNGQTDGMKERETQKKAVELGYKTQLAIARVHPERDKIQDLFSQNKAQAPDGMKGRLQTAKADSKLNNISMDDYYKIVQKVSPDKAQKIVDVAKAHAPSKGQTSNSPSRGGMKR